MHRSTFAVFLFVCVASCGTAPRSSGIEEAPAMAHYWYDVESKKVIVHATRELPPIKLPNGHEAVRAIKWECKGREETRVFVAFYRKFSPEYKKALESSVIPKAEGELISIDGKVWVSRTAPEAKGLMKRIFEPCRKPRASPSEVYPPEK